jgi:hypothetical protein
MLRQAAKPTQKVEEAEVAALDSHDRTVDHCSQVNVKVMLYDSLNSDGSVGRINSLPPSAVMQLTQDSRPVTPTHDI